MPGKNARATNLQSNRHARYLALVVVVGLIIAPMAHGASAATTPALPDLSSVPADLEVPAARAAVPAPGVRSVQVTAGWETTAVHHTLYLPVDRAPGKK